MELTTGDSWVATRDTKLAAAIITMGVKPFKKRPLTRMKEHPSGREYVEWRFEQKSECGRWKTKDLLKMWQNPDFHDLNPEHMFSYCMASLRNRETLLDIINDSHATITFQRDGQTWYVPEGGKIHKEILDEERGN